MDKLGTYQLWGADEIRILTMRGWVIVRKGKELQEEINNLNSSLPTNLER